MLLSMLAQLHQCHAFPAPIGTQAFLGNQRIKEFPGNRRTEAFLGNQMIKDFQTEKDSSIMQSNIVQQLHNLSLSNFSKIISTKKIGEILLPKQLHSYSKVLEFTKIQEALDNLMLNILNIDPDKQFSQFRTLIGTSGKKYFLSSLTSYPGANFLMCNELGGAATPLHIIAQEQLHSSQIIVTLDKVTVTENSLNCEVNGIITSGVSCIRQIRNLAKMLALETGSLSVNDQYKFVLDEFYGKEIYIYISGNDLFLSEPIKSYTWCSVSKISDPIERSTEARIVQNKYFVHLNRIYGKLLDSYNSELEILRSTALQLVQHEVSFTLSQNTQKMCLKLESLTINDCKAHGPGDFSKLDEFIARHNKEFLTVDSKLISWHRKLSSNCNSMKTTLVNSVYGEYVAMVRYITSAIKGTKRAQATLAFDKEFSSSDLKHCLEQYTKGDISDLEASIALMNAHNAKVRFLHTLCSLESLDLDCSNIFSMPRNSLLELQIATSVHGSFAKRDQPEISSIGDNNSNNVSPRSRQRRWFFTSFLAATTGLADETEVEKLKTNEEKLRAAEQHNGEEILRIENRANSIIERMKDQNSKLVQLYNDEQDVGLRLSDVITDTASLHKQLTQIVQSLEILSDVNIEYVTMQGMMQLIPVMLQECRKTLESAISDSVSPVELATLLQNEKLRKASFNHINSAVTTDGENFTIIFRVPEFFPVFHAVRVESLPIHAASNSACYELELRNNLAAINAEGETFLFDPTLCELKAGIAICSTDNIEWHAQPTTCIEALLVSEHKSLPALCSESLRVSACAEQKYLRKDGKVLLHLPVSSNVTLLCSGSKNQLLLSKGTWSINNRDCDIRTDRFVITRVYDHIYSHKAITEDFGLQMLNEYDTLFSDIQEIHRVNISKMEMDIGKFLTVENKEYIDLKDVNSALKKFESINKLENFTLYNVNLEDPQHISTVVAGLCIAVSGIILCACLCSCCACKCCRKGVWALLKLICKLLWWIACKLYTWLSKKYTEYVDSKNKTIEPTVNLSSLPDLGYDSELQTEISVLDIDSCEPHYEVMPVRNNRGFKTATLSYTPTPMGLKTRPIHSSPVTNVEVAPPPLSPIIHVTLDQDLSEYSTWRLSIDHNSRVQLLRDTGYETISWEGFEQGSFNTDRLRIVVEPPEEIFRVEYLRTLTCLPSPKLKFVDNLWKLVDFKNMHWCTNAKSVVYTDTRLPAAGFNTSAILSLCLLAPVVTPRSLNQSNLEISDMDISAGEGAGTMEQ